jgi:hypothetical protein
MFWKMGILMKEIGRMIKGLNFLKKKYKKIWNLNLTEKYKKIWNLNLTEK